MSWRIQTTAANRTFRTITSTTTNFVPSPSLAPHLSSILKILNTVVGNLDLLFGLLLLSVEALILLCLSTFFSSCSAGGCQLLLLNAAYCSTCASNAINATDGFTHIAASLFHDIVFHLGAPLREQTGGVSAPSALSLLIVSNSSLRTLYQLRTSYVVLVISLNCSAVILPFSTARFALLNRCHT